MVLDSWVDLRVVYKCAEMLCQLVFIESHVENLTWKSGSYLVYATLLFLSRVFLTSGILGYFHVLMLLLMCLYTARHC
jgi:hypothetical protein